MTLFKKIHGGSSAEFSQYIGDSLEFAVYTCCYKKIADKTVETQPTKFTDLKNMFFWTLVDCTWKELYLLGLHPE